MAEAITPWPLNYGETKPVTREPRQTKTQQRQLLDSAIGELTG
jgi:hypothetical protein